MWDHVSLQSSPLPTDNHAQKFSHVRDAIFPDATHRSLCTHPSWGRPSSDISRTQQRGECSWKFRLGREFAPKHFCTNSNHTASLKFKSLECHLWMMNKNLTLSSNVHLVLVVVQALASAPEILLVLSIHLDAVRRILSVHSRNTSLCELLNIS